MTFQNTSQFVTLHWIFWTDNWSINHDNKDSPPLVCCLLEQGEGVSDCCGHGDEGGDGSGPGDQLLAMLTGSPESAWQGLVSAARPSQCQLPCTALTAVAMLLLISPPPPQQQHGVQLPVQSPAQTSLIHYRHYTITYNYTSLLLFRKPINKIVSVRILLFGIILGLCTNS